MIQPRCDYETGARFDPDDPGSAPHCGRPADVVSVDGHRCAQHPARFDHDYWARALADRPGTAHAYMRTHLALLEAENAHMRAVIAALGVVSAA